MGPTPGSVHVLGSLPWAHGTPTPWEPPPPWDPPQAAYMSSEACHGPMGPLPHGSHPPHGTHPRQRTCPRKPAMGPWDPYPMGATPPMGPTPGSVHVLGSLPWAHGTPTPWE